MRIGRAAGVTDTGRRRLRNEDAFVCEPPLFAVTDGMGGARAGQLAAELAATVLEEGASEIDGVDALVHAVEEANRRIWERSVSDPETTGMGAVATVALVRDGTVAIGHVGDSRAYLIRGGAIEQLTKDHSLVAELVESGVLTPEEAEHHPQRSAITRALGTEPAVEVDVRTVAGEPGDVFLLCSDGLSSMVPDDEVVAAVEAVARDPERAAEALVAAANARGGEDNITVVIFELVGDADAQAAEDGAPPPEDTQPDLAPEDGSPPDEPEQESASPAVDDDAAPVDTTRHGAGPGGRLAAIALLAALLVLAILALYAGITR